MTFKKFVKTFAAGMLFPAVFLPLVYTVLYVLELHNMPSEPLQFIPMYIPILFGITNVLYMRLQESAATQDINLGFWITGAILGFVVAVFGIYVLHLPVIVFGLSGCMQLLPMLVVPVVYGAIFRYIVKRLNKIFAV